MTEAVFAVTPTETIKYVLRHNCVLKVYCVVYRTKLIDDAKRPIPQYRGLIHGTSEIVKAEGLRGIYRGLFPVVCLIQIVSCQSAYSV